MTINYVNNNETDISNQVTLRNVCNIEVNKNCIFPNEHLNNIVK